MVDLERWSVKEVLLYYTHIQNKPQEKTQALSTITNADEWNFEYTNTYEDRETVSPQINRLKTSHRTELVNFIYMCVIVAKSEIISR